MPDTVLSAWLVFTYVILKILTIFKVDSTSHSFIAGEDTDLKKVSNLPKINGQLAQLEFKLRHTGSKVYC